MTLDRAHGPITQSTESCWVPLANKAFEKRRAEDMDGVASSLKTNVTNLPKEAGYICLPISVLIFGSSLLPIKQYDVGDGEFPS